MWNHYSPDDGCSDWESKIGSLSANSTETEIETFNKNTGYFVQKNIDGSITLYYSKGGKEITERDLGSESQERWDENTDRCTVTITTTLSGGTYNQAEKKVTLTNLSDAAITVTENSSLTGKAGVQTTKAINVNTNSTLTAAGTINA